MLEQIAEANRAAAQCSTVMHYAEDFARRAGDDMRRQMTGLSRLKLNAAPPIVNWPGLRRPQQGDEPCK